MKIAVITGGERGLGFALSSLLISEGFKVFSLDLVEGDFLEGKTFLKVDISNEAEVSSALVGVGKVDLLINNAAVMRRGDTFSSSCDDFDVLFSVNVKGAWLVTKHVLPLLNRGAVVVMVSSRHSSLPVNPGLYGLSKKNVELLAELLEKESFVKNNNISVKSAVLGPFRTDLSRTGFSDDDYEKRNLSSKEEVAGMVFELIFNKAKKLCFDGEYFFL